MVNSKAQLGKASILALNGTVADDHHGGGPTLRTLVMGNRR
jgi:hypothetical protein